LGCDSTGLTNFYSLAQLTAYSKRERNVRGIPHTWEMRSTYTNLDGDTTINRPLGELSAFFHSFVGKVPVLSQLLQSQSCVPNYSYCTFSLLYALTACAGLQPPTFTDRETELADQNRKKKHILHGVLAMHVSQFKSGRLLSTNMTTGI
jgi:hypothetical protein